MDSSTDPVQFIRDRDDAGLSVRLFRRDLEDGADRMLDSPIRTVIRRPGRRIWKSIHLILLSSWLAEGILTSKSPDHIFCKQICLSLHPMASCCFHSLYYFCETYADMQLLLVRPTQSNRNGRRIP